MWTALVVLFVVNVVGTSPLGDPSDLNLWVGISSLASVKSGQITERQLEVSWNDVGQLPGDRIILFQYLSETSFCQPEGSGVVEDVPVTETSWIRLNTSIPYFAETDLLDERCQLYWVAYIRRDGSVLGCNCIRARPNWMWDLRDRFRGARLRKLFMSGTHDAAAYEQYRGIVSNNVATKYAITQGENLFNQLAMGVRYLDIRISLRPNNSEALFWTHHGTYYLRPLINDTALVREFITRSREIVIFDIHGLDNMERDPNSHQMLQELLYNEFGPWMAPQSLTWNATLEDFWAIDKRLIVTYANAEEQAGVPFLWKGIEHQWGNVNTVPDLETYLQSVMNEAEQGKLEIPWSSMAELTPTASDVITDSLDGLRGAADVVNPECWGNVPLFRADWLRVFLTLSPLARSLPSGQTQQRQIELNWHGPNGSFPMEGDWIGLYEHDPTMNPTLPLRRVSISTISGYNLGYYKTDVQFSYQEFDRDLPIGDSCLGYWIGYIRNGATIAANCLKIRPSWMWQNRGVLGSVPIKKFFLPGTHNSGSYKKYEGSLSDTVVSRYSICQDEDIWSQLVYGVRYLDIRVGYYPNRDDKFWMNHDLFRINPLRFLLEDLRNFLRVTREIVILDFHRFPVGFNQIRSEEIHMELVTMIVSVLGDFMVPSRLGSHATLNDLWHLNRTLIVTYADDWTRRIHPLLWPSIPQEWGDKKTAEDLFIYLQGVDRKRVDYTYFWAAMAELTPTTSDIIFRARDGLRKFQDTVARNITTWYRDLWWKTTSIVAVDFFHSTDIIDVAVEANLKSVQCSNVPFRQGTTTSRSVRSSPNSQVQQNRRFYQGPRSIPSQQPSHFLRS